MKATSTTKVKLLHSTPLSVAVNAIRTCYDSKHLSDTENLEACETSKLGHKDVVLVGKCIDNKHYSVLEHIVYNFHIENITRAVLQELARHRIASYSVKSTRYTLAKELKEQASPLQVYLTDGNISQVDLHQHLDWASKYIRVEERDYSDAEVNITRAKYKLGQLSLLIDFVSKNSVSSDQTKHLVPECYLTELFWTINARSLRNFLELRSAGGAYYEIQELAQAVYNAIPVEHKFLYADIMP